MTARSFAVARSQYRWALLAILAIVGLVLGYVGLDEYYSDRGVDASFADLVYADLKLLGMGGSPDLSNLPWELDVARFLLPFVFVYGAFLGVLALFRERVAQARLPFIREHSVIIGLGEKGAAFTRALRAAGHRVVAVEIDATNPNITSARALGGIVVVGDARDPAVLATVGIRRSRHLILVGPDAVNADVVLEARAALEGSQRHVACLMHSSDVDLCVLLRLRELRRAAEQRLHVDFFNVHDRAARILLDATDGLHTTAAVIATQPTLRRLVTLAAHEAGSGAPRPRVTVVAEDATEIVSQLKQLRRVVAQVDLAARDGSVDGWLLRAQDVLGPGDGTDRGITLVCVEDDGAAVEATLSLLDSAARSGTPMVVCLDGEHGVGTLLREQATLPDVTVISVVDGACTRDLVEQGVVELIARGIHSDYVEARLAEGTPADDPAMVAWDELAPNLQEANRENARHLATKLTAVSCDLVPLEEAHGEPFEFDPDEVELLSRLEHDRWWRDREAAGYTLGPERDAQLRTSPYLVPWEELPEDVRELDRVTVRALPRQVARAGFGIVRLSDARATQ
jgi:hypothetical protein